MKPRVTSEMTRQGGHFDATQRSNTVAKWALILGVFAHLAGFFLFAIAQPGNGTTETPAPQIVYPGHQLERDAVLAEQSELFDFEPLFLPTTRNASIQRGARELVERTEPFSPLPARLLIGEEQFPPISERIRAPFTAPDEALARQSGGSFAAFGQRASDQAPLPSRRGLVEVFREGFRQPLVRQPLEEGIIDEALQNLSSVLVWQLVVSGANLPGTPLLVRGSGLETVDAAVADYLIRKSSTWGLESGYYQIVVGP